MSSKQENSGLKHMKNMAPLNGVKTQFNGLNCTFMGFRKAINDKHNSNKLSKIVRKRWALANLFRNYELCLEWLSVYNMMDGQPGCYTNT